MQAPMEDPNAIPDPNAPKKDGEDDKPTTPEVPGAPVWQPQKPAGDDQPGEGGGAPAE